MRIIAEIDMGRSDWLAQLDRIPWAGRPVIFEPIEVYDDGSGWVGIFVEALRWDEVERIQLVIKAYVPSWRLRLESEASYYRRASLDAHARAMGMPPRSGRDRVVEEVRRAVVVPEPSITRFEREPVI